MLNTYHCDVFQFQKRSSRNNSYATFGIFSRSGKNEMLLFVTHDIVT
jgi:hypothetical protein